MSILDFIIFFPLLGAGLILAGSPGRATALGVTAGNLALGLIAWLRFDVAEAASFQFQAIRPLLEQPAVISYAVGIDGLGLVMVLLSVIVSLAAVWLTPAAVSSRLYFVSLLLISSGALGAFCSTDLFFFYAFHELALIPTFLMIGIWGSGEHRVRVAWKITLYLVAGSMVLLLGLIAFQLQLSEGGLTFSLEELQRRAADGAIDSDAQKWIFLALLLGFGTLVSLFPFHSWAAPAYAAAPPPTAMLHAGVLKKFGLYGLIRFVPMLPEGLNAWRDLLVVLLLGNILFIGFVTLAERRLGTMLGYSSVMHMGFIFLGIASWQAEEPIGMTGAVILMFAHGISIALLFGLAGKLAEGAKTLEFDRLGGLAKSAPIFAFIFGLAAFASLGLPGFANFSGEVLVFFGGFQGYDPARPMSSLQVGTILALWGVVISAVYMLRAYRAIFLGRQSGDITTLPDVTWNQRAPLSLLVLTLLIIGFYPKLFSDLLKF